MALIAVYIAFIFVTYGMIHGFASLKKEQEGPATVCAVFWPLFALVVLGVALGTIFKYRRKDTQEGQDR